ncbi:MAG: glycine--tRNA ligase subunit beta [Thermoanaerobaculia bacterium]
MAEVGATAGGEFLLEVRVEEIPARMLPAATRELGTRLFEELMARGLAPSALDGAFTPRRLVLILRGVPAKERDRSDEVLGPPLKNALSPTGEPTAAVGAFARKCDVAESELRVVEAQKGRILRTVGDFASRIGTPSAETAAGEYLVATRETPGRATADVLAELVPRLLAQLAWAKTMRWGSGVGPWVRPVHGVVALFDGEVVPFELFGVAAGNRSAGHPTLSPEPFAVHGVEEYLAELDRRGIVIFPAERQRLLAERMAERATALGGTLVPDEPLLEKLAAICEIPGVMEGSFAPELVSLPREVLATSLRDHQSALTVEKDGALLPVFLTVMDRPDDPVGRVRAGNEWVVAARLADARFFFEKDRSTPLAERAAQLAGLTFHDKLGSYAEKAERLAALATTIAGAPAAEVEQAARLLKVDLTTDMVKEFTSLQGQVGGIYARAEGAPEAVWTALYDQYLPASADDPIPRGAVAQTVALADRIDTLVGFFGLGLVPTGSKDPFGLRRAALGVVRIVLDGEIEVDLAGALERARELLATRLAGAAKGAAGGEEQRRALALLSDFLRDRLAFVLGENGSSYDEIAAAMGADGEALDLRGIRARALAVRELRGETDFVAVAQSAKRIANIVRGLEPFVLDRARLSLPAESALGGAAEALATEVDQAVAVRDFRSGLRRVAALAPALDRFFVDVLVMDPDEAVKSNRLALLQSIHRQVLRLADLSQVVVEKVAARTAEAGQGR